MLEFTDKQRQLALALYDVGAVMDRNCIHPKLNPEGKGFRLVLHEKNPGAPLSPFYLNLRTPDNPKPGPLTPEIVREIGDIFYGQACLLQIGYDHVVGVPRAGDPFAEAFSEAPSSGQKIPLLRMNKSEEGGVRQISGVEGAFKRGDRVLVVDDLITKGGSKILTLRELEGHGLKVTGVIILVNREQGGMAELQQSYPGVFVHAIFRVTDMLQLYRDQGRISPAMHDEIVAYLRAN